MAQESLARPLLQTDRALLDALPSAVLQRKHHIVVAVFAVEIRDLLASILVNPGLRIGQDCVASPVRA